jgi:hypothetical protein
MKRSSELSLSDFEPFFSVVADYQPEGWEAIDAECHTVCYCPLREMAELIAKYLNEDEKTFPVEIVEDFTQK